MSTPQVPQVMITSLQFVCHGGQRVFAGPNRSQNEPSLVNHLLPVRPTNNSHADAQSAKIEHSFDASLQLVEANGH